ncbi:MAG: thiamine phosphate synthase [Pirellulales bacterium]|nr:thiamine phosphate synthase [Pirellulales bacterium]
MGVLRVIDAEANRASEGLRVVEDYVRFVLDDRHLTERLKRLRHALSEALTHVPMVHRLAARDTLADVGTNVSTGRERPRTGCQDVVAANFARVQESLRSLEEYGKLFPVGATLDLAARMEQLRYESYTLHRAVETMRANLTRLAGARLYVLIEGQESPEDFDILARDLVLAGVDVLQLRDKRLADRELLSRARLLRQLTQGSQTLFVMNDRPDLAALARADGVHVGQEELSIKDVRAIVGPESLVGVSVHGVEQAREAVLEGADYLGVGPTFPSKTKPFETYPGPDLLRAVAAEIRLPAFAVGGIDGDNVSDVLATGFRRVAVGRSVTGADNPATAVARLLELLGPRP